jgi:hypothetical protein
MVSIFHSNYKEYSEEHVQAVLKYCGKKRNIIHKLKKYDKYVLQYFYPHLTDMKSLLEADAMKLIGIKKHFDSLDIKTQKVIRKKLNLKGLYNYFIGSKFQRDDGTVYNSAFLASHISVPVCPYCNENYTYNIVYKKYPTYRRSFDWDHLYNKDKYPFLAVSYFNLVPSCKFCNFIKLNQNLDFLNPHLDVNADELFQYYFHPFDLGFLQNEESIKVAILYNKKSPYYEEIKHTVKTAALLARVANHKMIIRDTINRHRIYPDDYLSSLPSMSDGDNTNTGLQYYESKYSVSYNSEEYYMRPFSKLTKDVLFSLEKS